ncbi:MAG: GatB/YqeY domain-containing protein [Candidatus Pacebacteria bacterium]|nr:GatB/YqeY domain-containing protein [Candidatus Paceibacterota bacterium]
MLTSQVKTDMIAAMKAREQIKVDTLRGAMTAFTNELVAKGRKPTEELADTEAVAVLKRLAKQRKDSIEQFTTGNRPELAAKEADELKILEVYLPQTVSREAIKTVAEAKKVELGITDASGAGKLMGAVIKEFAGTADGADVKAVVTELLA